VANGDATNCVTPGQEARRILLVDDNRSVLFTLLLILKQEGYVAEGAASVAAALDYVRQHRPQVVITDINLPDGNGVDLAIQIHGFAPDTRLLLTSGDSHGTPALELARQRGFNFELVCKPVPPPELLAKIKSFF
jgi:two-component system response regulator PilR (NtrC family)